MKPSDVAKQNSTALVANQNRQIASLSAELAGLRTTLSVMAHRRRRVDLVLPMGSNIIEFGLIGDSHFGSRYEAKDQLLGFYETLERAHINTVFHAGDVLAGHNIYKGQEFEVHAHGWEEQKKWFVKTAPRVRGVRTKAITGNHDSSFTKSVGINVGAALAAERPDWEFIAADAGRVELETKNGRKFSLMLLHPDGGTAYALSYKPQKIIEQLSGGSKPDMIGIGHFHKAEMIPNYRNVCSIQTGCWEFQTPFMTRRGISAMVGGWIVRVVPGHRAELYSRIQAEFIPFY